MQYNTSLVMAQHFYSWRGWSRIAVGLVAVSLSGVAWSQVRVATFNVTNYDGADRLNEFRTIFYSSFQGRQLAPDVVLVQEVLSQTAVNAFRTMLNGATGSPGDWVAAPYLNGTDSDGILLYRSSRFTLVNTVRIARGQSTTTDQPRDTMRYDLRPVGYTSAGATIAMYNSHMKSGSTSADQSRRLIEAQRIRLNSNGTDTPTGGTTSFDQSPNGLPAGYNFLIGGDFNIQTSSQAAYQELVGSQVNNSGRFFDPINTPGSWNNNISFRFVHTQDPATAMDDRLDFLLLGSSLVDGFGMDYIGNPSIPFSTSTWNDPNHSYRVWGNDGTSFNAALNQSTNAMVGSTIAAAMVVAAENTGHLPVYLDMRMPPKISSSTLVDFGTVRRNSTQTRQVSVFNTGDTALFGANGIGSLRYQLTASAGFSAPSGLFTRTASATPNTHTIQMDTTTPGLKTGTITIGSNAPDEPIRVILVRGRVTAQLGG
ncbi:MAG TPA: hypothetical protein PLO61_04545 [Fimbriimonadaceae bacterium]|nr:hypothetical protein [Fimbriimonadaceae bacterium]HRJ32771.1 hypothetical protein [Fimbriimonadaceae bacterium]